MAGELRGRTLWVVLACLVCQMALGYGYALSGPLAPHLLQEFGWSRALLASAQAPQIWIIGLISPLLGWLLVRVGPRTVMTTGALLLGAAFVIGSGLSSWAGFAAVWTLQGLAVAALGDISVGYVVSRWTQRARGLALGIAYTGSNLGGKLVGGLVAGVAETAGWRTALLGVGLGAFVFIVPAALFAGSGRPPRALAEPSSEAADGERDLALRVALRTRSFWILAATLLAFWLYLLAILQHYVLHLVDQGMPRVEASWHFTNAVFMGVASKILFGLLADRVSPRSAILLDYGLLALSALLLLAPVSPPFVWGFVIVFGFSYAARDVVTPLVISHCFGLRSLPQIYGTLMLTFPLGGTLGPIFAGYVQDATGSYGLAFGTFAALMTLSFLALLGLRDERAHATP